MINLITLPQDFTVCKITDPAGVNLADEFLFLARTDEELSLVCETKSVPANVIAAETGWKGLKIAGALDFSLVGIMAGIAGCLAAAGISLFVVSTYNTDYIFLKEKVFAEAVRTLRSQGYRITQADPAH